MALDKKPRPTPKAAVQPDMRSVLFRARDSADSQSIAPAPNVLPFPKSAPLPSLIPTPRRRIFSGPALSPDARRTPEAPPTFQRRPYLRRRHLPDILVDMGVTSKPALAQASLAARENGQTLERTLVAQSVVTAQDIAQARARQYKMGVAHPLPRGAARDALAAKLPSAIAERYKALPWLRIGNRTLIAICNPSRIDGLTAALPDDLKPSYFAVVSEEDFERRFAEVHGPALARAAECRVPEAMSCRRWRDRGGAAVLATILVGLCIGAVLWPTNAIRVATALGLFITLLNISIRVLALRAVRQHKSAGGQFATIRTRKRGGLGPLPEISVMVPLHNEPDIAPALKARLARLDYPRELLDILLVVEEYDTVTRDALETADLPPWIRVVPVPDGQPRTKPRAMNYALGFARGQIVGIYDAEDAPAPDQLRRVAARFATAAPDVACLQGRLDFYNPTRNWMSRCFTIEYANWFRLVLPGISKLGLVVPLGGTTLFFRRNALEHVGGWDAHNVTEDADLGVRLARQGYKTEIIDTTTLEEANACPKAWVKQRSRWMKGYVLTWAVHTRRPLALWRDLGAKRFWGFHALFISAILNAVLMPFLWSTIIIAFGLWHPILDWMPGGSAAIWAIAIASLTLLNGALAMAGCHAPHHRRLRKWVPTLEVYFGLATLAVTKALIEIALRPFHWDKTTHGTFGGAEAEQTEMIHLSEAESRSGLAAT